MGAKFVSLQCRIAIEKLFFLTVRYAELRAAHFGAFDQALMLKNDLDPRDRFDNRFAKNQLLYGSELVLQRRRFVACAGAPSNIHGAPFLCRDVGNADERAVGAKLVALGDKAVVTGENAHDGMITLERVHALSE